MAMVINAIDNGKFGPGGGTQHLHQPTLLRASAGRPAHYEVGLLVGRSLERRKVNPTFAIRVTMEGLPSVARRAKEGVTQLSTDLKNYRLCPVEKLPVGDFLDIRSKKVNANDNFANDNLEFAPVAKAAIA